MLKIIFNRISFYDFQRQSYSSRIDFYTEIKRSMNAGFAIIADNNGPINSFLLRLKCPSPKKTNGTSER